MKTDRKYAEEMIPHHEMAVKMSKMLLDDGSNDQLKEFAKNVIAAQTKEIAWLKNWLANNPEEKNAVDELLRLLQQWR